MDSGMVGIGGGVVMYIVLVGTFDSRSEGQWFKSQSLPSCCRPTQEILLHFVSLHPGVWNGYRWHTAGGNPAMD